MDCAVAPGSSPIGGGSLKNHVPDHLPPSQNNIMFRSPLFYKGIYLLFYPLHLAVARVVSPGYRGWHRFLFSRGGSISPATRPWSYRAGGLEVSYRNEPSSIREVYLRNIQFSRNSRYHPVVPCAGQYCIFHGREILLFEEIPGHITPRNFMIP